MNKLLTIIVPSYNVAKYLARGCESLNIPSCREQLEVLIVNDGSKDSTSDIGRSFAKRYPDTFRVVDKTNGNYGSCINRGLAEATGVFVKIMDGDDSFDPDGLAQLAEILNIYKSDDSEVDAVLSRVDCINEDGKRWPDSVSIGENSDVPVGTPFDMNQLPEGVVFSMHTITYRTSVFRGFSYHQTEGISYTDNEWRIIPMAIVRKAVAIPAVVYLYLVGRDGQTMNPDTYAANLGMVMTSTQNMVARCEQFENDGVTVGSYTRHCLQDYVDMMYLAALCGWKNYSTKLDIVNFDHFMELHGGDFYEQARKRQIRLNRFPLSLLSFYPVRVWDRWHTVNAPRLLLHRMLKKFVAR